MNWHTCNAPPGLPPARAHLCCDGCQRLLVGPPDDWREETGICGHCNGDVHAASWHRLLRRRIPAPVGGGHIRQRQGHRSDDAVVDRHLDPLLLQSRPQARHAIKIHVSADVAAQQA